jgi:hypothetical protein
MTGLGRRLFSLLLLLAGLAPAHCLAQPAKAPTLGLCPPNAGRLDAYLQLLCEGEAALHTGDLATAIARFRSAAALPRVDASNELAWAGLAITHCRTHDVDNGRQWAAHFTQARQLWLGELDCAATGEDPRARLSPFVRSRMCAGQLAADYAAMRDGARAAHASELRQRLARIDEAVAATCAAPVAARVDEKAGTANGGETTKNKTASKKRGKRAKKTTTR